MTLDSWVIFTTVFFVATIAPGPGMLLAMSHAIAHGRGRFMITAAGQISASFIQTVISLAGLGAIMMSSVFAFEVIRWAGALYLIYLGIKIWRAPVTAPLVDKTGPDIKAVTRTSNRQIFKESFLICLGNPKAIVFFGSLFPQFITPDSLNVLNLAILGTSMTAVVVLCVFIWSSGGGVISKWLTSSKARKYFNRTMGGCFIGAGVGVAASR